MVGIT